jgi:hypothetical protein
MTVVTAKSRRLCFELNFLDKTQGWRMLPEDFYLYKDNSQLVFLLMPNLALSSAAAQQQ